MNFNRLTERRPDIFAIMKENMRTIESPDYEPPSPKQPNDDSPSNKIAQISSPHNKTVDGAEDELPSVSKSIIPPKPSASDASYVTADIEPASTRTSISGPATRTATLSDNEMPDLEPLEEDDDAGVANQQPPTPIDKSAAKSLPLPRAVPTQNVNKPETITTTAADVFEDGFSVPAPHPKSIAARKRAENFDPSELDSWIKKQSEPKPEPTEKELLEGQLWGHIDPRIVWPKEYSEEWYATKRAEIDARPSRKQRFGKVRRQYEERQLSDYDLREMERFAKEFGGIEYSADFELEVREGVLVMVERNNTLDRATGEIRRKKKDLQVYRVG
jgi:hypothetical protein